MAAYRALDLLLNLLEIADDVIHGLEERVRIAGGVVPQPLGNPDLDVLLIPAQLP